ncbi:MAG: hypothetical protein ACJ8C4_02695 [Gemmataceae bacterium]
MKPLRFAMFVVAFGLVTAGVSGDDKAAGGKSHGQLPPNWSKLGLDDKQKTQIYDIRAKYTKQIDDLKAQITAAQEKERKEAKPF